MANIQSSINAAIGSAAKGAVAAKGLKEAEKAAEAKSAEQAKNEALEAQKAQKQANAENLRAIDAVEGYRSTALKAEGAAQSLAESQGQSAEIQSKIEEQRQKLSDPSLSVAQKAGHKGYITRMREAQSRVDEQAEARRYQKELLEKRMEVLRSIHGEAWVRLGIDPEGGTKHGD